MSYKIGSDQAPSTRGTDETLVRLTGGNLRHSEARVAKLLRELLDE